MAPGSHEARLGWMRVTDVRHVAMSRIRSATKDTDRPRNLMTSLGERKARRWVLDKTGHAHDNIRSDNQNRIEQKLRAPEDPSACWKLLTP
ncbi:hypothetical protein CPLU01_06353 [Colletotrichum plurivorum]|uniref:Uncharacterized protein n=1 Tax=Colletotrichum plurivorum TaxID=2175906 RepID=A0A8H6KIA0_9PEZI|nr:hypothetical protein CPLU01_06353 [Colletotrichum plurivorum]